MNDYVLDKTIFYFFPKFLYLLSRNCFTIKNQIFTSISGSVIILSRPYLGDISLKTRTKLRKSFKGILSFCKLQIIFKSQRKLANVFWFKDCLLFNLVSGFAYMYGRFNSPYCSEMVRNLIGRSGEHISISPLIFRKVKPSKESTICDHLLNFNSIPSVYEFTVLKYGHHKYIPEIKESLLIKRDVPVLNKNIDSAKLFFLIKTTTLNVFITS